MTDPIQPAALSIREAASYARLSRATIYRLLAAPGTPLRASKIGTRRVILRESVDALLANGAAIPAPPKSETPPQAPNIQIRRKARGKARRKARAA